MMTVDGQGKKDLTTSPGNHQQQLSEVISPESTDKGMEALVGALRYLFIGLRVLILVLLFTFFFGAFIGLENFGGFFYIDEHEEAMLFRFGRLTPVTVAGETREVFGSGVLRWRWPYPVDEVKRIGTQRPVLIQTDHFWPRIDASELDPMRAQEFSFEQGLIPGHDGYLLTGDTNIMHMTWMLSYRVVDPKKYYIYFNDTRIGDPDPRQLADRRLLAPQVMVRNLLEQAVLREVATWSVEEVWRRSRVTGQGADGVETVLDSAPGMIPEETEIPDFGEMPLLEAEGGDAAALYREFLSDKVRQRVNRLIAAVDMGIEVHEVNLLEVQPPRPCLQAFLAVNEAAQVYRQTLDAARSYETRILAGARTKANALVAEGEAYKSRIVARAEADAAVFEQIQEQYQDSPESVLVALYSDTLRSVLPNVKEKYVMPKADGFSQEVRLLLGPESLRQRTGGGE